MDRVLLGKITIIERCLNRITLKMRNVNAKQLARDFDLQDIVSVNLQRACQAAIDIALYVIRQKKLGVPDSSGESFQILAANKIISKALSTKLQKMVGFRNVVVHEYQEIDWDIVYAITKKQLKDFHAFIRIILTMAK